MTSTRTNDPLTTMHQSSSPSENKIMACSAKISQAHLDLISRRKLCDDRKACFEHIYPLNLVKSTIRIVTLQSLQVMSIYVSDQLKFETELNAKVSNCEITEYEADVESSAWTEREWGSRIEAIPHRIAVAIAKYHAVTLVIRLYEYVASKVANEVTLDKLTLDTSDFSKRAARSTPDTFDYLFTMFGSCWNANMISYLADYSVHQMILLYGYYLYIEQQHIKKIRNQLNPTISDSANNSSYAIEKGSIALSCLKNSIMLAMNRTLCLTSSSLGGAIGSLIYPGYGTLFGINIGDALAINLADEYIADKSSTLLP